MVKFRYIVAAVCLMFSTLSKAQVIVDVKIDSLQLLIGEQTCITLDVTCDAKQQPVLPQLKERAELTPGVEVVRVSRIDTTMLNDGKRMQLTQRYTVTAFDSSLCYLPPMEVLIDTTRYKSKALALRVLTVPVDTTHLDMMLHVNKDGSADLVDYRQAVKDIQTPEFNWDDWKGVMWGGILTVLLIAAIVGMAIWLRKGEPVIRLVRRKTKLPAHQVAMSEIERIKQERNFTSDDSKEYYTQLTDTLRTYIQERYGFRAMDMTSGEIIEHLMQENDQTILDELRQLFQTADLVKFAKYSTLINENDANLLTAINYINQTKQEIDPNAEPEKPEYTPEEMRSIGMKWTLRVLITICTIGLITAVVLITMRLVDLMG